MLIDVIVFKLGLMEGLTIKDDQIVEWPYQRARPTREEITTWTAEYHAAMDYKKERKRETGKMSRDDILWILYSDIKAGHFGAPAMQSDFYKKMDKINNDHPAP